MSTARNMLNQAWPEVEMAREAYAQSGSGSIPVDTITTCSAMARKKLEMAEWWIHQSSPSYHIHTSLMNAGNQLERYKKNWDSVNSEIDIHPGGRALNHTQTSGYVYKSRLQERFGPIEGQLADDWLRAYAPVCLGEDRKKKSRAIDWPSLSPLWTPYHRHIIDCIAIACRC